MASSIIQKIGSTIGGRRGFSLEMKRWLAEIRVNVSETEISKAVDSSNEPLVITAIGDRNVEILKELLANGCDPNCRCSKEIPALSRALMTMDLALVKVLIAAGADVNLMDKKGRTPMFYAHGFEAVGLLLDSGALTQVRDSEGKLPVLKNANNGLLINEAMHFRNSKMISMLLSVGCDLNYSDSNNELPIIWALKHDNKILADALITHGAEINICDSTGMSVLERCLSNVSLVNYLAEQKADMNFRNKEGKCPLEMVFRNEVFELLLKKGADPNSLTSTGCSLLYLAITQKNIQRMRLLIQAGIDVKGFNEKEKLVFKAISLNSMDALKELLCSKFDCNEVDEDGLSVLGLAYKKRFDFCFPTLIDAGADVNFVFPDSKDSILMCAICDHKEPLIDLLLERGADVNYFNEDSRYSPLKYAVRYNNMSLFNKLLDLGARTDLYPNMERDLVEMAAKLNNRDMVKRLVKQGVQISSDIRAWLEKSSDEKYEMVTGKALYKSLRLSVVNGDYEYLQKWLEYVDDINQVDKVEEPLLYVAMMQKNTKMMRYLIKHGANVNARILTGKSLLFCAVESNEIELVNTLIEAGVDANATDALRNPAIWRAIKNSNYEIVKSLVDAGVNLDAKLPTGRKISEFGELSDNEKIADLFQTAAKKKAAESLKKMLES